MADKKEMSSRRVPAEKAASLEDIRSAIDSLSDADLLRLEKFANFRIAGLGRGAYGREGKDLLHQAIVDTVDDVRRWNKLVDFARHLHETIRSISSNWAKQFKDRKIVLESEVMVQDSDGKVMNPILNVPSADPDPENVLESKGRAENAVRQITEIQQLLRGDSMALEVFSGLRGEMSGPEIREALGITQTEYETIMRRICRRARGTLR